MKSCCFTGHRTVNININLLTMLMTSIESYVQNGIVDFYSGGAIGWDTICSNVVLQLREKYPNIKLHLILPCNTEHQTLYWNEHQKLEFNRILQLADTIEYTSWNYHSQCMKIRNARLVQLADVCICYCDNRYATGTAQTVRMAKKKNIPIINLYDKNRLP